MLPHEVKRTFRFLPELLIEGLQRSCTRSNPLPSLYQVLVTLEFLATRGFFYTIGLANNMSKVSAFRSIKSVCTLLCDMRDDFIKQPCDRALQKVKLYFFNKSNIPGIAGCVDSTLIRIHKPANVMKHEYICRKKFPAINVQVYCSPDNLLYQTTVHWPGATNDSRVFKNSSLKRILENCNDGTAVLGDSGYGLRKYLLVPVRFPSNEHEHRYNNAHWQA